MLGLFYVYTAFRVATPEQRPHIACASGLYTLALGGASLLSFTPYCPCTAESAFGLLAMSLPLMFYASPVPAMVDAIRRRSAESLHAPLASMSFCNAALWCTYGLSQGDWHIYVPQSVGVVLAATQIAMVLMWRETEGSTRRPVPASLGDGQW